MSKREPLVPDHELNQQAAIRSMRRYRYACEVCGERFELKRAPQDRDEPADCPRCRTPFGKRLLSAGELQKVLRGDVLTRRFAGCG